MSLIVRMIDLMDQQLAVATAEGLAPSHFILREDDWAEMQERFKYAPELTPLSKNAYKGVFVQVGEIGEDNLAVLVSAEVR